MARSLQSLQNAFSHGFIPVGKVHYRNFETNIVHPYVQVWCSWNVLAWLLLRSHPWNHTWRSSSPSSVKKVLLTSLYIEYVSHVSTFGCGARWWSDPHLSPKTLQNTLAKWPKKSESEPILLLGLNLDWSLGHHCEETWKNEIMPNRMYHRLVLHGCIPFGIKLVGWKAHRWPSMTYVVCARFVYWSGAKPVSTHLYHIVFMMNQHYTSYMLWIHCNMHILLCPSLYIFIYLYISLLVWGSK